MHNDIYLEGLRREHARAESADRAKEIQAEIDRVEALPPEPAPRPAELDPDTASDWASEYLAALEREKGRSDPERHPEIDAEIARVNNDLRSRRSKAEAASTVEDDKPPKKASAGRSKAEADSE